MVISWTLNKFSRDFFLNKSNEFLGYFRNQYCLQFVYLMCLCFTLMICYYKVLYLKLSKRKNHIEQLQVTSLIEYCRPKIDLLNLIKQNMRSHMRKYDHKVKRKSLFFTLPLGLGPELLLSGFRPTGEVWGTGSGFSGATCWVTGSCFGLDFTLVSISLFFSSGRLSSGRLSLSTESSVFLSSDLLSRSSVWKRNKRDSK